MSSILKSASRLVCATQRSASRSISSSAVSRKDIVKDLYLGQLKSYKPPAVAKDAHVGVVKAFSAPTTPSPPATPADLASELAAFDASEPHVESASTAKTTQVVEDDTGAGATEFLAFLEKDLPKPEHHHH